MADATMSPVAPNKGSARNVVAWVLSVLVGAEFLLAASLKLVGNQMEVDTFAAIGWGQWFRYFTGVLEILGAIGLFFPGRSRRSAVLLALIMLGAITFHLTALRHTQFNNPLAAIVTLVLLLAIARLRRDFAR